jgi:hypothetical protein
MEQENLYQMIQGLLGDLKGTYNVLEEQIDVDTQLEYFEESKRVKKALDSDDIIKRRNDLFSGSVTINEKKLLLNKLACIDNVEVYRALEKYKADPDSELKDWASLALHENRMLLESTLLDENQVFISTGLGGKGTKLRYFIVFLAHREYELGSLEEKVIASETTYVFSKFNAEVEEIKVSHNLATIKAIIPMETKLNEIIEQAIENCNVFGDFLQDNFIVTNVKELSFDEIEKVLQSSDLPDEA